MAAIDISSTSAPLNDGVLQLQNGVAMDSTLRNVADQNDTTSPLKLSTTAVQVVSPLRITTDDPSDFYLDCEDGSTNNRFSITRNTASQQVNVDFASNPGSSTEIVGGIRTYVDGVNLSNVMQFRRDGRLQIGSTAASAMYWDNTNNRLGIGTNAPVCTLDITGNVALNHSGTRGKYYFSRDAVVLYPTKYYVDGGDHDVNLVMDSSNNISLRDNAQSTWNSNFSMGLLGANVGINDTLPTARLSVKGSGSTSATTSLLVQNSAGSNAMTIKDDLSTNLGGILNLLSNSSYISASGGANSSTTFIANTLGGWNGFAFGNSSLSYFAEIRTDRTNVYTPLFVTKVGNSSSSPPPTPNASAILQADSTTQGFLPPRMTNAQRAAITTPAIGLMVYCTDAVEGLYVYKSTGWTFVI